MEKETKKHLIIGATIVIAGGIGVVIWKKYQTQPADTQQAASDQSNQDELSLLAASLESNAYASQTSNFSPAAIGTSTPKSLADEVLALEQALGIAPAPPVTTPTTPAPTAPASGSGSPATPAPHAPIVPDAPTMKLLHDNPVLAMDGVHNEEGMHIA